MQQAQGNTIFLVELRNMRCGSDRVAECWNRSLKAFPELPDLLLTFPFMASQQLTCAVCGNSEKLKSLDFVWQETPLFVVRDVGIHKFSL